MMKLGAVTREHCYQLTSQALTEHWWRKLTLPQLKKEAQAIRQAQKVTMRDMEGQ